MTTLYVFLISLAASVVGAIVGVGGGVIIKPTLDAFGFASVSTISFLSGCTVLSMSAYSVGQAVLTKDNLVQFRTCTLLGLGAAFGGIVGQQSFIRIRNLFQSENTVGAVQSFLLLLVCILIICYVLFRHRIRTHRMKHPLACILTGFALGILSSFLGIGGGPINVLALSYLFSMDSKTAAQNSIYIILFCQSASLITSLITGSVPMFEPLLLLVMIIAGVGGAVIGRKINRRVGNRMVDRLYLATLLIICGVCAYNIFRFL